MAFHVYSMSLEFKLQTPRKKIKNIRLTLLYNFCTKHLWQIWYKLIN